MTPKEKAEELYRNYWVYFTYEQSVNSIFKHAKQCALIAVDEIMKVTAHYIDKHEPYYQELDDIQTQVYWEEVKKEIEKL